MIYDKYAPAIEVQARLLAALDALDDDTRYVAEMLLDAVLELQDLVNKR